jgi:hypothetical protein
MIFVYYRETSMYDVLLLCYPPTTTEWLVVLQLKALTYHVKPFPVRSAHAETSTPRE